MLRVIISLIGNSYVHFNEASQIANCPSGFSLKQTLKLLT